jgi:hypothetical protein
VIKKSTGTNPWYGIPDTPLSCQNPAVPGNFFLVGSKYPHITGF